MRWGCSRWRCSADPANRPIGNRPLLIYSASLLIVGTQLVSLGILAELVTSYNIQAHDTYSIAETVAPPDRLACAGRAFRVMKKYKYDDEAAEGDEPAESRPDRSTGGSSRKS